MNLYMFNVGNLVHMYIELVVMIIENLEVGNEVFGEIGRGNP